MVPLKYWFLRLCRRATPKTAINFMLDRGFYLKPGGETSRPHEVAALYSECVARHGLNLKGSTICVVGYGGSYGIGIYLLENGARRVILQDPYAPPKRWRNRKISADLMARYFRQEKGQWIPDKDKLVLVHEELSRYADRNPESVDFVVSRSTLEHVSNVEGLIMACWLVMRPGGLAIHFINLQDHFPGHPFEMLCYKQKTWDRWLNASNNLNRLRLRDYEGIFQRTFPSVNLTILTSKKEEFKRLRGRIRSEFLTGNDEVDAAAIIRIEARK
jgi:SAM-dependent methyltransferase